MLCGSSSSTGCNISVPLAKPERMKIDFRRNRFKSEIGITTFFFSKIKLRVKKIVWNTSKHAKIRRTLPQDINDLRIYILTQMELQNV